MAFVTSQGARIYYKLEGLAAKPLLVMVHSLGTDHAMWDPQMAGLLDHFQVLRVDLRGHGASDAPAGDYTIEQLSRDVLAAVDASGRREFAFCGLSLGGMIGLWLGANAGDRLTALVLANTTARMADPSLFETRRKTVLEQGMPAIVNAVMQRFFSERLLSPESPAAASIRITLLATPSAGYAGCCAAVRDMDQLGLRARVQAPTLVIAGDRDLSTPWQGHGELLAEGIAGAQAVQLDAAHLSNLERPSSFTHALLDFLVPRPTDLMDAGSAMRRSVLGDAYVDGAAAQTSPFTREFQELITSYAWGSIWTRPGLDVRTRRLLTLAITASLGRWEEFRLHVRAAELEAPDVQEALLQTAIYAGVPAANAAFKVAAEEFSDRLPKLGP